MKKLLTLTVALVFLVAFSGLSAAQEKKPVEPAAIPWADKVTLSATPKNVVSKTGCPVTARVGHSANPAWVFPGNTVNFVVVSGPGPTPASGQTDAKSEVKRTVKGGQTVRATIQTPKGIVTSNSFACGEKYPTK
jgi:hypothetical protein